MKQEIENIANALKIMAGVKPNGRDVSKAEFEKYFLHNILTEKQLKYLVRDASTSHQNRISKYKNLNISPEEQADFIQHAFHDGLGKLLGAIYGALDFSEPDDWVTEIQQMQTLTTDLVHNAKVIFDGLDKAQFPFYATAIKEIEDNALPALKCAMEDNGISIQREYPLTGSEFFYKLDRNNWRSLVLNNKLKGRKP